MTLIEAPADGTIRVLSLDGGGVRGLLHARFLACLEEDREIPVRDLFDVIAGTSTGALIAAGLVAPRPAGMHPLHAQTFAQLYRSAALAIFPQPRTPTRIVRSAFARPGANHPLANIQQTYIGPARLADADREICIPALDLEHRCAVLFTRAAARASLPGPGLAEIAAASAAAPTYLPSVRVTWEGRQGQFVDGGLFANDPTLSTVVALRARYPGRRISVLSLGTGSGTTPAARWPERVLGQRATARNAWWLLHGLEIALEGTSSASVDATGALLGGDYLRVEPAFGAAKPALDDSRIDTTRQLLEAATDHWKQVRETVWRFLDGSGT